MTVAQTRRGAALVNWCPGAILDPSDRAFGQEVLNDRAA